LLNDELSLELVVTCGDKPTVSLLQKVFSRIQSLKSENDSIELHVPDGSLTATKTDQNITVTTNIYFTSSKFQPKDDQTGKSYFLEICTLVHCQYDIGDIY